MESMLAKDPDTCELLRRAEQGDQSAGAALLSRNRGRLRKMIAIRMDPQLRVRVDPSDVVQEALAEATRKLPDYLRKRPIPLYPWLRQIAWEWLVRLRERHVKAQKRSVYREARPELALPDESVVQLVNHLVDGAAGPSELCLRKEMQERVRAALDVMKPSDREVLVMWYLEQLTPGEIAAVLDLSESGVRSRHRRALMRLTRVLNDREED